MCNQTIVLRPFILGFYLLVASIALIRPQASPASASGAAGQPKGITRAQAPEGLELDEWFRILERLPGSYTEIDILHTSDAQQFDNLGVSIAINGDTLVVGAPFEDGGLGDPSIDAGAAYVFERDLGGADNWGEAAILHASDAQADDWFGYSVAISGDTVVVGAYQEDGGQGNPSSNAGAAYIFERDLGGAGNWGEAEILHASDAQIDDGFGVSIAIDGDTLVIGAAFEDGGLGNPFNNAGAAYIFERDLGGADNWGEAAILHASDAQASDLFGISMAISGDTIVVGASAEDGGAGDPSSNAGAVYLLERDLGGADNWGEAVILHASDAQAEDRLGTSVAISGDTLVVGAPHEDGGPGSPLSLAGAGYVFERDLGGVDNWGEAVILHASDAQPEDMFGTSVAISGDTLVVGALFEDGGPGNPISDGGAAYVFERDLGGAGSWGEAAVLHASDAQANDLFGGSMAMDGSTIASGAPNEWGGPGNPIPLAGAAYIFTASQAETAIFLPVVLRQP